MFLVGEISNKQSQILENYFCEKGEFNFEGCWLRNQRLENAKKSGYIDESTQRRRYIHFYDTYTCAHKDNKNFLALKKYYLYVTNTLPQDEIQRYLDKIYVALQKGNFVKFNENLYKNDNGTNVIINLYKTHPRNTTTFPENYQSLDIVVCSEGYDYTDIQNRMWKLSTKMYRMPDKRENPTYIKNVEDILQYLPAQVEMGCGPSISANIPPLHNMHETYKVQNHISGKFYFADEDDLLYNLISNEKFMRNKFSVVPMACISSELTEGYKDFGQLYKMGIFKGIVYNNNFDRLVNRMDIPEKILRLYDLDNYITVPEFDKDVKSLICMGCHADRRQIQKQARQHGLKVIYIDPEGFYNDNGFEPYLIEGPKSEDIILNLTFEQAMKDLLNVIQNTKN